MYKEILKISNKNIIREFFEFIGDSGHDCLILKRIQNTR